MILLGISFGESRDESCNSLRWRCIFVRGYHYRFRYRFSKLPCGRVIAKRQNRASSVPNGNPGCIIGITLHESVEVWQDSLGLICSEQIVNCIPELKWILRFLGRAYRPWHLGCCWKTEPSYAYENLSNGFGSRCKASSLEASAFTATSQLHSIAERGLRPITLNQNRWRRIPHGSPRFARLRHPRA
jgi:hypothetical protein